MTVYTGLSFMATDFHVMGLTHHLQKVGHGMMKMMMRRRAKKSNKIALKTKGGNAFMMKLAHHSLMA